MIKKEYNEQDIINIRKTTHTYCCVDQERIQMEFRLLCYSHKDEQLSIKHYILILNRAYWASSRNLIMSRMKKLTYTLLQDRS